MNCSALGTLCGSMCKALSMNCFNKQVIFVGQVQDEQFKQMLATMKLNDMLLDDSGSRVITLQSQATNRKLLKDNPQSKAIEIRLGMYELIRQRISKIHVPTEGHGNGWYKVKLAGALCKIHFGRRYKKMTPFTKKELKRIDQKCELVKTLYIPAIFLWNQGKVHLFDVQEMTSALDLSKKVSNYLEKKMIFLSTSKLGEPTTFWQLDMHVQKVFFKAASYLTKEERKSIRFQNASLSLATPHHRGVSDGFSESIFAGTRPPNEPMQVLERKDNKEEIRQIGQLTRMASDEPLVPNAKD